MENKSDIDTEKDKQFLKEEDEIVRNLLLAYKRINENIVKLNTKPLSSLTKSMRGFSGALSVIEEKEEEKGPQTETLKILSNLISEIRQTKNNFDTVTMTENIITPFDKFVEVEINKVKESKKLFEKQSNDYVSACGKVKDKQFLQKLQINKLLSTLTEKKKQANLYKTSFENCKQEFDNIKSKQEFDIFDLFYNTLLIDSQNVHKEKEMHDELVEKIESLKEWISASKKEFEISKYERKELQDTEAYEEELCKYNPLVELLAHPLLELCSVIFDIPCELNLPRLVSRVFDGYEQTIPILKELVKKSPTFVGNQMHPLFHLNKPASLILKQLIFLYQENVHSVLLGDLVEKIVASPEEYEVTKLETLSNLIEAIIKCTQNWASQASAIPNFIVCISHLLVEHFDSVRALCSLYFFSIVEPAFSDPSSYNLCEKTQASPRVCKILATASKFVEYSMFSQKYSLDDFSSELNKFLEVSTPLMTDFFRSVTEQPKLFEQLVDIEDTWKNELPTIEKFLCENYHQISLTLLERGSKDKLIGLSDALASLKRTEEEIKVEKPVQKTQTSNKLLERPRGLVVMTKLKYSGEVISAGPNVASPYRKSAMVSTPNMRQKDDLGIDPLASPSEKRDTVSSKNRSANNLEQFLKSPNNNNNSGNGNGKSGRTNTTMSPLSPNMKSGTLRNNNSTGFSSDDLIEDPLKSKKNSEGIEINNNNNNNNNNNIFNNNPVGVNNVTKTPLPVLPPPRKMVKKSTPILRKSTEISDEDSDEISSPIVKIAPKKVSSGLENLPPRKIVKKPQIPPRKSAEFLEENETESQKNENFNFVNEETSSENNSSSDLNFNVPETLEQKSEYRVEGSNPSPLNNRFNNNFQSVGLRPTEPKKVVTMTRKSSSFLDPPPAESAPVLKKRPPRKMANDAPKKALPNVPAKKPLPNVPFKKVVNDPNDEDL